MASFVGSRSETKFSVESKFKKAVSDFGSINTASVLNDIASFELAWRKSIADDELPGRYKFKPYKGVHRPYKLYQIYVGQNHNYRAVVMFFDGFSSACWIYAFKKERMNERQEVELAKSRAEDYWYMIKGR
jgi:hypothetical protein